MVPANVELITFGRSLPLQANHANVRVLLAPKTTNAFHAINGSQVAKLAVSLKMRLTLS
jgi:hypothetical protein